MSLRRDTVYYRDLTFVVHTQKIEQRGEEAVSGRKKEEEIFFLPGGGISEHKFFLCFTAGIVGEKTSQKECSAHEFFPIRFDFGLHKLSFWHTFWCHEIVLDR